MEYGGSDGEVGFWPGALVWPVGGWKPESVFGVEKWNFFGKFF